MVGKRVQFDDETWQAIVALERAPAEASILQLGLRE